MEILGVLLTITKTFDGKRDSEDLESRALGLFHTLFAQTTYTNDDYPFIHDANRLPVTWSLIIHSLLSRLIADGLIRNDHCAVTPAQIKQHETEIGFAKSLHDMARRCAFCSPT